MARNIVNFQIGRTLEQEKREDEEGEEEEEGHSLLDRYLFRMSRYSHPTVKS